MQSARKVIMLGENSVEGLLVLQTTQVRSLGARTQARHCRLVSASSCNSCALGQASAILATPHDAHSTLGPGVSLLASCRQHRRVAKRLARTRSHCLAAKGSRARGPAGRLGTWLWACEHPCIGSPIYLLFTELLQQQRGSLGRSAVEEPAREAAEEEHVFPAADAADGHGAQRVGASVDAQVEHWRQRLSLAGVGRDGKGWGRALNAADLEGRLGSGLLSIIIQLRASIKYMGLFGNPSIIRASIRFRSLLYSHSIQGEYKVHAPPS